MVVVAAGACNWCNVRALMVARAVGVLGSVLILTVAVVAPAGTRVAVGSTISGESARRSTRTLPCLAAGRSRCTVMSACCPLLSVVVEAVSLATRRLRACFGFVPIGYPASLMVCPGSAVLDRSKSNAEPGIAQSARTPAMPRS